jgi:hypothetical protein
MKRLALATALFLGLGQTAWADFNAGIKAYQRDDYATAYREWKPLAKKGDPAAQYNLGLLYHFGLGVRRDEAEAAKWYGLAAEQGDADAQHAIGDFYIEGLWGKPEYAEAAEWFRLAAEQGHAEAQRKLGALYARGRGVPKNQIKAAKWLRRAAKQGDAKAKRLIRRLARSKGSAFRRDSGDSNGVVAKLGRKCPSRRKVPLRVTVRVKIPAVSVNHDLSIDELTELSSFHGPQSRVLGLTTYKLEVNSFANYSAVPHGNRYCFWVDDIDLPFRYNSMDVYIASEYGEETCPYRVTMEHEQNHVRVARRILKRYTPRFEKALSSAVIPTGRAPVLIDQPADAKHKLAALYDRLIKPVYQEMWAELERDQAALDTPQMYRQALRRCRNW